MSPVKEPNFFNSDHLDKLRLTRDEYERLFEGASSAHAAVGEASPWYLYSKAAVPAILDYSPDAKFIVCLRDPVAMAYSLHNQSLFAGTEQIEEFERAWRAQPDRTRGLEVPAHSEPAHLLYGPICRLGEQMDRLQRLAGKERVHAVFLDDIRQDPSTQYRDVLRFLGAKEGFQPDFRPENQAQQRRFPLLRRAARQLGIAKRALGLRRGFGVLERLDSWNRKPHRRKADPAMAAELRDYFRADVQLLARITGRDLSAWLNSPIEKEASAA